MTDIVVECVLEKKSTNDENRMCRICLSLSNSLIPIFKQDGGERELYEKIQKHVPVNISETDSFPQHVCHECANTIVAWDSLYVLSLKTDEKLKSLIISINFLILYFKKLLKCKQRNERRFRAKYSGKISSQLNRAAMMYSYKTSLIVMFAFKFYFIVTE